MSLKQKLANNDATVGSWITFGHSAVAELMARIGFDWLVIDMEHSAIDRIREAGPAAAEAFETNLDNMD